MFDDHDAIRLAAAGLLADTPASKVPETLLDAGFIELLGEAPGAAMSGLFKQQGKTRSSTPSLDLVAMHVLGLPVTASACMLYPRFEHGDMPSTGVSAAVVRVEGLVLAGHDRAEHLVVPVERGGRLAVFSVRFHELTRTPVGGVDPDLGLAVVEGRAAGEEIADLTRDAWEHAILVCRTALAHELLGVAAATLDLAVTHVAQRRQFGRPLAAQQTARHRLADVTVAIESAREILQLADTAADPLFGQTAKALAGRAALLAVECAQQLCGAMGFTDESPLHRYGRRAWMLDALLGSASRLQRVIGARLLVDGDVPLLVTL